MRRAATALALLAAMGGAPTALAQAPSTILSSRLTAAEGEQLGRTVARLSQQTRLQQSAIERLAVEIYGAQPQLQFTDYVSHIEAGAQQLRAFLAEAEARSQADPEVAEALAEPIALAEEGRVTEARSKYDAIIAGLGPSGAARSVAYYAESARLSLALGDFGDAAARFAQAAEFSPAGSLQAAEFGIDQADALRDEAFRSRDFATLSSAVELYEAALDAFRAASAAPGAIPAELGAAGALTAAVPAPVAVPVPIPVSAAAPVRREEQADATLDPVIDSYRASLRTRSRELDPMGWALTQTGLGDVLLLKARRGDDASLANAVHAYRAALEVRTRARDPQGWAALQMCLGDALRLQGERGEDRALAEAVAAYEAALEIKTRDDHPHDWAKIEDSLGGVYLLQGARGQSGAVARSIAAYRAALNVRKRGDDPQGWADTQTNLGIALQVQGASPRNTGTLRQARNALRDALEVRTRASDPLGWAKTQYGLAFVHRSMNQNRDARRAAEDALEVFRQFRDQVWVERTEQLLERIEQRRR